MTMLSLGVLAAHLAVAPTANLEGAAPAEVAPVEPGLGFDESVTKREREPLRARFEEVLAQACEPPPCTNKCRESEASLGVELSRDDRDYSLNWVARDPRLDAPLTLESSCELCSLVELEDQLATDLGSLCTRLSALEGSPARLRVSSDPTGATVRIDGKKVGKTPWVGELGAGAHNVEVGMRGYENESRSLQLVSGVEESLSLSLMSEFPTSNQPVVRRPLWPGWTGIGVGVAFAIAGTALIALDNKDYQGDCQGNNVDAYGNCAFVYNTVGLGGAFAALGAAAFGAGVGLMVWAQKGQYSASIGLRGRF